MLPSWTMGNSYEGSRVRVHGNYSEKRLRTRVMAMVEEIRHTVGHGE